MNDEQAIKELQKQINMLSSEMSGSSSTTFCTAARTKPVAK